MNAYEVNAFDALIPPPAGAAQVSRFIAAAGRSLGYRSDADLARTLGVPNTTLASWKRRGVIPEEQWRWFSTGLFQKIAERNVDLPQVSRVAKAAVIELIGRTGGNPVDIGHFRLTVTAGALGGLLALAQMFADLDALDPWRLSSDDVAGLVRSLEAAMPQFRQGTESVNVLAADLSQ